MRKHLVIATRGSRLALWQAEHVKSRLEAQDPGLTVSLNVIKTKGDIILDVPLSKVGGKGLFVKEIEEPCWTGGRILPCTASRMCPWSFRKA